MCVCVCVCVCVRGTVLSAALCTVTALRGEVRSICVGKKRITFGVVFFVCFLLFFLTEVQSVCAGGCGPSLNGSGHTYSKTSRPLVKVVSVSQAEGEKSGI